mmetsp:Transcript_8689/g.11296  ORF Transcript_8689/g.11296 Transcript_8689/m.11296 type:complete len:177 (+) Transcript_8689:248-778(+)
MSGSHPEAESEPPTVVLQCRGCKNVFGDTLSLTYIDPELKIVSLKDVSACIVESKRKSTSKEGFDSGAVFYKLSCKECDTVVGKKYVDLKQVDALNEDMINSFTFHDSQIATYQVGSLMSSSEKKTKQVQKSSDENVSPNTDLVNANATDISKVKYTIVAMEERIRYLEQKILDQS